MWSQLEGSESQPTGSSPKPSFGRVQDPSEVCSLRCVCVCAQLCPTLCDPWTVAHPAPLSMGFPRQEYWSGLPFPSPGFFPTQGLHLCLPHLLHWQASFYHCATWKAPVVSGCSVIQSCLTLQPHDCSMPGFRPSLCPWVCSNSCPLSQWCHPTISSSVTPFSSCPQYFPASGSFPISQLFAPGCHLVIRWPSCGLGSNM